MTNMFRLRCAAVLLFVVSTHTALFGQIFRNIPRRVERQPAAVTVSSSAVAKTQLQRLASEIKADPRQISENDLNRFQKLLLDAVNDLQRRLPREFDRETADNWKTTLQLSELKATLESGTPESAILETVQNAFYSDKEGIRWTLFDGLRTTLRRYQTVARMLKEDSYERQLTSVCDNLVNYIESYIEGRNPLYFVTLSEAAVWLDDIRLIEPRAVRLAELMKIACSGVNVQLQFGNDLAAAGFQKEINQILDINEMILGTRVIGDGILVGTSNAELVHSLKRAAINVLAEATLETNTDGKHHPVTLKNYTTGTIRGEKQILFDADGITTIPARSRAKLSSQISDVRINAGPIIKLIARGQIDSQREDSQAEAARRAERRMNAQMDERIDSNIAEVNEKYQKIRNTLNKTGLFPRVWNLSSTADYIDWSILLGNAYQPSAPIPAPVLEPTNGLAVQVHQSALNNMLAILLSGRSFDEEKTLGRIEEFLGETPKFLKRKTEEPPAKVSFGARAPVDVLFIDNKIRVVVRLNDIQVLDNASRSFSITVEYQIKMEKQDGRNLVVFEQTEAEAFPTGYRPDSGQSLSIPQTMIRSYLMRRLEALPKRQEAQPLDLGGEWEGQGQLIPQFSSADKGWLTLVWRWE